jgi:hypothetical protein
MAVRRKRNGTEPKNNDSKIEKILTEFGKNKQNREKERFISKVDNLYSVLLTISIFFIGLFISQNNLITSDPLLSFPIIGIILVMIFSFIMGLYGVMKNRNEHRIYAWVIVISCLPLILLIALLVNYQGIFNQILNQTVINTNILLNQNRLLSILSMPVLITTNGNLGLALLIPIFVILLDLGLSLRTKKWLERIFIHKHLKVRKSMTWFFVICIPLILVSISIILSVIVFMMHYGFF